jgi:tripartite-type tricarboxylate transporter receptor subunit TctC
MNVLVVAAGAACFGILALARAGIAADQQTYPSRPIRFIVPFPPGGSTDPMARLAATRLAERWGSPVVVDNRPGGNTIIGTEAVARAQPDGYTMLLASSSMVNTATLIPKLPYDATRDFTGVATIAKSRLILTVPTASPANTLAEFIALAKAKAGQLTYASSGVGSNTHLAGALLNLTLGMKMHHIPYKGSGTLAADLIGARVDFAFQVPISVISHIRAGKLKALAIIGEGRAAALPDVPTFAESGMQSFGISGWYGIVMPTGSPRHAIDKMSKEIAAIVAAPDAQEYLSKQGLEAFIATPDQFTALIKADIARHAKIIRAAGIKFEH